MPVTLKIKSNRNPSLDTYLKNPYTIYMIFPLQELVEYEDNMYEITCAASHRAYQLSILRDPEVERNEGKVVSMAAQQVFTKEIEFRIEETPSP